MTCRPHLQYFCLVFRLERKMNTSFVTFDQNEWGAFYKKHMHLLLVSIDYILLLWKIHRAEEAQTETGIEREKEVG